MTEYSKLVEALNRLWQAQDTDLEDWVYGSQQAMHDSAAAIEVLQDKFKELGELLDEASEAADVSEMRAEELQAEVDALQAEVDKYKTAWAVERENRLGVEEPKRGEWIERYDEDDKPFFKRKFVCSACGHWNTYGKSDYCPKCGAKMEAQDG